jgi:hypothetical protein
MSSVHPSPVHQKKEDVVTPEVIEQQQQHVHMRAVPLTQEDVVYDFKNNRRSAQEDTLGNNPDASEIEENDDNDDDDEEQPVKNGFISSSYDPKRNKNVSYLQSMFGPRNGGYYPSSRVSRAYPSVSKFSTIKPSGVNNKNETGLYHALDVYIQGCCVCCCTVRWYVVFIAMIFVITKIGLVFDPHTYYQDFELRVIFMVLGFVLILILSGTRFGPFFGGLLLAILLAVALDTVEFKIREQLNFIGSINNNNNPFLSETIAPVLSTSEVMSTAYPSFHPTTLSPTTAKPTTAKPTTAKPTTPKPTTTTTTSPTVATTTTTAPENNKGGEGGSN